MIKSVIAFIFGRRRPAAPPAPAVVVAVPAAQPASRPGCAHHQEDTTYVIVEPRNGQIPGTVETRELSDSGVTVHHVCPRVMTARSTLAKPEAVVACCQWCGLVTDEPLYPCDACALGCCTADIRCIQRMSGEILQLCPECLDVTIANWPQWKDGPPPRPFSITRLTRKDHSNGHTC